MHIDAVVRLQHLCRESIALQQDRINCMHSTIFCQTHLGVYAEVRTVMPPYPLTHPSGPPMALLHMFIEAADMSAYTEGQTCW